MPTRKLTPEEKLTIKTYNEGAINWKIEHSEDYWVEDFKIFKNLLPNGKILEVGCGAARDAKKLVSFGYDYIGVDVAKEFVKISRKLIPNVKFFVRNLYDLKFKDNEFDGFWSAAVFLHIPKVKIDLALKELKRVTKPNAIGFIAIKKGIGESIIEEEFSKGKIAQRFWSFYSKSEFSSILKRNNLQIIKVREWSKSKRTTWLIYFVKNIK